MVNSNSRPAEVIWNYDRVELIADGIVHAIGVSLGLAGAIAIVVVAANSLHTTEISSIVVYSIGLLSMLGFSAAYNTWPVSRAKWVLRRFDHSAIFVMIAGTYTPFIAHMKADLVAMGLLIGVWLTAVVGIILRLLLPGRFDRLAVVLYLLLRWSGAVVFEPVVAARRPCRRSGIDARAADENRILRSGNQRHIRARLAGVQVHLAVEGLARQVVGAGSRRDQIERVADRIDSAKLTELIRRQGQCANIDLHAADVDLRDVGDIVVAKRVHPAAANHGVPPESRD